MARLVFLQSLEHPGNKRVELEGLSMIAITEPDLTDIRQGCLKHCLRHLSAENRELIIEYYRKEGRQKIRPPSIDGRKTENPAERVRESRPTHQE